MLILLDSDIKKDDLAGVVARVESLGFKAHVIPGSNSTAIGVTGNPGPLDPRLFEMLPGVKQAIAVTKSYKLAGRDFQHGDTTVDLGRGVVIGAGRFIVMAGPCAVESLEQTLECARKVRKAGALILRGGAFKPRSSPYAFQGLGRRGLEILADARRETGLPVITEVMTVEDVPLVAEFADILQIGARNSQNFNLLDAVGRQEKPVLLKRGLSGTIEELLLSAEYILSRGNPNVILCERGIRTFEKATRNTLDISAVPVLKKLSHLPVVIDPSHATGVREYVAPLAKAAVAVGADGVLIEVHPHPEKALCDGPQSLTPEMFEQLVSELRPIAKAVGLEIPR